MAFCCNWAPYRCYLELCESGLSIPPTIYTVKVMCSGRVDPAMVLFAFERGAEGVMVLGCKDRECKYGPGPGQVEKMAGSVRGLMRVLGLEPARFATVRCSCHEKERLSEEMASFAGEISRLGKSPLAR